ncbi:MAG TPA: cupin domain-containing protein [Ktedonobacteraceae bacterium]|nr:cupin domain-containing protein [Ktedonobacteraceae bacterium]
MPYMISREQLRSKNSTYLFQGREQQDLPISFFWMQTPPGDGPRLHAHPYPEIFVVQEGHATFTVGEDTIEVEGAHDLDVPGLQYRPSLSFASRRAAGWHGHSSAAPTAAA